MRFFLKTATSMKNLSLPLLVLLLCTSCYSFHKVRSANYAFSDSISFTIDKVTESKSISGFGGAYNAKQGYEFILVTVTMQNELDEEQDLNWTEFALLNPETNQRLPLDWVLSTGAVVAFDREESHIGAGDKKKRKLVFTFPSDLKPKYLMVGQKVIEIPYMD
mgnify:CR=1 FL=1